MKYAAAFNQNNLGSSYAREYISLSPKYNAASTYTDGFNLHSPKAMATKAFVLAKSSVDNTGLLHRGQKSDNPLYMQAKIKTSGSLKGYTPTTMLMDSPTPSHKKAETIALNAHSTRAKDAKKSSSATKLKSDSYRPMSSTPKNLPGSSYRSTDSMRMTSDLANGVQYRWKKLEISTEFNNNNSKSPYLAKAQTTKHTETDDHMDSKHSIPAHQSAQAVQKSLQAKSMNTTALGSPNSQNSSTIKFDNKFRSNRPQSSSASAKNRERSLPNDSSAKENLKGNFFMSDRDSYGMKTPNKAKTPGSAKKLGNTDGDLSQSGISKKMTNSSQFDYRNNYQTNEPSKKDKRPYSAKKSARDNSKDELDRPSSKIEKTAPQKPSLNSFITKVNKGDTFGGIKKHGDKRDSARENQQKPYLTLDDNKKPIKTSDLEHKGSRTATNTESKTYAVNLSKSTVQAVAQTNLSKNGKNSKSNASNLKEMSKTPVNETSARLNRPGPEKEPFIYYMTNLQRSHKWEGDADYFVQIYREHFIQSFQALSFCRNIKLADANTIAQKRVHLPRRESHKDKKTVVFDMDETLIHCNESLDLPADVILPIVFPNGEVVEAGINIRPYAVEILKELSQHYEVIVFTASHSCYANVVLDYLDPEGEYIHHRLFRESCVVTEEGVHIKDLRVIGNRNLQDVILVDNAAYSFGFQIENGIPIIPFYDNKNDQELRRLTPYLKFLSTVKDIRDINKQTFKMHLYSSFDSTEAVLERLIFQD